MISAGAAFPELGPPAVRGLRYSTGHDDHDKNDRLHVAGQPCKRAPVSRLRHHRAVPGAPDAAGSGPTGSAPHAITAPQDLCPLLTADEVAHVLGGPAKSRSYVDEALGRPTCYWKRTDSQGVAPAP